MVRGVSVRVISKKGHAKLLRRPVQHIYPLEVCQPRETDVETATSSIECPGDCESTFREVVTSDPLF